MFGGSDPSIPSWCRPTSRSAATTSSSRCPGSRRPELCRHRTGRSRTSSSSRMPSACSSTATRSRQLGRKRGRLRNRVHSAQPGRARPMVRGARRHVRQQHRAPGRRRHRHLGNRQHVYQPQTNRVLINNNLFYDIDAVRWGGLGRLFQVVNGAADVVIEHITGFQGGNVIGVDLDPSTGFVYRNNIAPDNGYGIVGAGDPRLVLATYLPGASFMGNVIPGADVADYPAPPTPSRRRSPVSASRTSPEATIASPPPARIEPPGRMGRILAWTWTPCMRRPAGCWREERHRRRGGRRRASK